MKHRYLVIDDDLTFAETLVRRLRRRGHEAELATEADAALDHCRRLPPTRVILDLKLAETSGLQLLPQLRQLEPVPAVVVLTGYSSVATAVSAIKLGATHYLAKPAGLEEILAAFESVEPLVPPATLPSLERVEWEHIQRALDEHDGNIAATARALGMHRRTLQRKLLKRPVRR
jgi:two-component system response regulator RegA